MKEDLITEAGNGARATEAAAAVVDLGVAAAVSAGKGGAAAEEGAVQWIPANLQ